MHAYHEPTLRSSDPGGGFPFEKMNSEEFAEICRAYGERGEKERRAGG
jgi:hypothetical protein